MEPDTPIVPQGDGSVIEELPEPQFAAEEPAAEEMQAEIAEAEPIAEASEKAPEPEPEEIPEPALPAAEAELEDEAAQPAPPVEADKSAVRATEGEDSGARAEGTAPEPAATEGSDPEAEAEADAPSSPHDAEASTTAAAAAEASGRPSTPPAPPHEPAPAAQSPAPAPGRPKTAGPPPPADLPEFYDIQALLPPEDPCNHPRSAIYLHHVFSWESSKRNNLHLLDSNQALTTAGNYVILITLDTLEQRYLVGIDGGGIGAVAVHPARTFLAVAEKKPSGNPAVYIYEFPSLRLVRVLREGTERAYSAVQFNEKGDLLATVGSYPDYMLTIWDWRNEGTILRSKAFSQEVFNVTFSNYFDGHLITSGTGHIRFWKMAATFTGLKLQGQIGKFGAVELSDVAGYCEMPDGKVIAGTETGELHVWDGGLIKTVVTRADRKPCHQGAIDVVVYHAASNHVITAGADGFVRIWDANLVNDVEAEEDSIYSALEPLHEVEISTTGHIRSLLIDDAASPPKWVIMDAGGGIYRVSPTENYKVSKLLGFHAGGIADVIALPKSHQAVTAGRDGTLRVYDYRMGHLVMSRRFDVPQTAMASVPSAIDPAARVFLTGGEDGVLRVSLRCHGAWKLVVAVKPHKGAITKIAVSPDGTRVATGGADETVYFFEMRSFGDLVPICFTKVGFPVTCLSWALDSQSLVVGGEGRGPRAHLVELQSPRPEDVNTSSSFEHAVPRRDIFLHVTQSLQSTKSSFEKELRDLVDSEMRAETGSESGSAEGAEAAAAEAQAAAEKAAAAHDDSHSRIETCLPLPGTSGRVLIGVSGAAHGGRAYLCDLEACEPSDVPAPHPVWTASAIAMPVFSNAALSTAGFSRCGKLWILGSSDGRLRVTQTETPFEIPDASARFWESRAHDSETGFVNGCATSFDNKFLLSVSSDGSFMGYLIDLESSVEGEDGDATPMPTLREEEIPEVDDVADRQGYTLEEAKQKAERDALLAAAESKKLTLRERVKQIHDELERMLAANEARPEVERLPLEELVVDVELSARLEEHIREREVIARKELEWDSARARLAVEKLRTVFLDPIECERIAVWSIQSQKRVTTFRCPKVAQSAYVDLEDLLKAEEEIASRRRALGHSEFSLKTAKTGKKLLAGNELGATEEGSVSGAPGLGGTAKPPGTAQAANSQDARRIARMQRKAEWERFVATKPDEKHENPGDIFAIRDAVRTMGDFKLKLDPNYVAPEELQMNAPRKRRQMIQLSLRQYEVKASLNQKILALRERKMALIKMLAEKNARLLEVAARLGREEHVLVPRVLPEELPERRYAVSEEDLAAYSQSKEDEAKKTKGAGGLGGFATSGAQAAPVQKILSTAPTRKGRDGAGGAPGSKQSAASARPKGNRVSSTTIENEEIDGVPRSFKVEAPRILPSISTVPSPLELTEQEAVRVRLEYELAQLQLEIRTAVEGFDAELDALRSEKYRAEASCKAMDLRRLVMHQEWMLLKDFEKREVLLMQKFHSKEDERMDISSKMEDCTEKMEEKQAEVERVQERKATVIAQFNELVPEKNDFRDRLLRIFNRRIKRAKKAAEGGDDDSDESDEEEEMDDEDLSDDEEDGDACPPGCDQLLYEKVCELRERRLNEEEALQEYNKSLDQTRKERESQNKKLKVIESALKAIERDITEFQREKQAELNKLTVKSTLSLHQIWYLLDRQLPLDLSEAMIFSGGTLERLKARIGELIEEKAELRVQQKQLHRDHLTLNREMRTKEDRIRELEGRAREIQLLKFGQLVDLEVVDRLGMDRGQADLRLRIKAQEAKFAAEIEALDRKVHSKMEQLAAATRENTSLLTGISGCLRDQRDMERTLEKAQSTLFVDVVAMRKKDQDERDKLVRTVNVQAEEIQRLKAEIGLLSNKTGRIYK